MNHRDPQTRIPSAVFALLLLTPLVACGGERELWQLWQRHLAAPEEHAAVVQACRAYAAAGPDDPFLPVVHGIESWHLLRADKTTDAIRRLSPYMKDPGSTLARGAQRLTRAWFSRIQRERVVKALQYYYRKEVRYPQDLQTLVSYPGLPGAAKLPLEDAFGKAWRYRLTGFEAVPGFRDQKYELESSAIQPPWDPAGALALPYAEQIQARPMRVSRGAQGTPVVRLEYVNKDNKKETSVSQVGATVDGIFVAHAGSGLVILCDTLHWKVIPWADR